MKTLVALLILTQILGCLISYKIGKMVADHWHVKHANVYGFYWDGKTSFIDDWQIQTKPNNP